MIKLMPELWSGILKAVEENPDIFIQPPDIQLQTLIIEPFSLADHQICRQLPFLVVIDSFDECNSSDEQSVILHSISRMITTHRLPLCFLIMSCPAQ
jgi:hypothetical protein